MKVKSYLKCGCLIMEDESRQWCPSCRTFEPMAAIRYELDILRKKLAVLDAMVRKQAD